jgi:hypothetical protein
MGILDFFLKPSGQSNNNPKEPLTQKPSAEPKQSQEKSFWDGDAYKRKESLKLRAERMSPKVDGFYNPIDREHREKMVKEIFGDSGNYISKADYKKRLEELEKRRQKAKSYGEKKEIENLIKFYKAFDKAA